MLIEKISARGHKNISATHPTTFEITKEDYVTLKGDCIVAICADKCFAELSEEFRKKLQQENSILEIKISCDGVEEKILAYGSEKLTLKHPHEMVVRKSDFVCERTLAIKADKAAKDFDRKLVEKLKNPKNRIEIELRIKIKKKKED